MEIEVIIAAEVDEIGAVTNALSELNPEITVEDEEQDLSPTERAVLRAVRENPGRALRSVHETAAQYEDSPIEWVDSWGAERETVQSTLHSIRGQDLLRLEERSWYPVDESEA